MALTRKRPRPPRRYLGVTCPHCDRSLRRSELRSGRQDCPFCFRSFEAVCFQPVQMKAVVREVVEAGPDGAASCATHERNVAVASCERCGQFMCDLCRIEADEKVLCAPCFDRLSTEGALASTVTRIKNFAGMSTLCILLGIWCLGPFGLPVFILGIYYAMRGLKDRRKRGETDGIVGLWIRIAFCALLTVGSLIWAVVFFQDMASID